ncbi:MAP3K12-binding inhibitory protein 1-like isoform X2 [Haliotis rubra]|uniref:MAP3K12-binding inhibitory protein 1-like isoform X2 n=1 Tax=Haliotis rubra TaxID=36100 RepID=UPI001EE5B9C9|nr:MAP3K12-binding inhibitory protein 1-like isoform X2 [Haliotis rubra]
MPLEGRRNACWVLLGHSDVGDGFEVKNLLKVSQDQQLSVEDIMLSVGKLIDQLQTVHTHLAKKIKQDKVHNTEVPNTDTDMETSVLQRPGLELTDPPVVSMVTDTASDMSESVLPPQSDCRKTDKRPATTISPYNVQIKASKEEVDRRINAFIEKKQTEVNQQNNREFCSVLTPDTEVESSCARTDAVFVPRAGCKSHIKISRVVNPYGPQTRLIPEGPRQRFDLNMKSQSAGFEERMRNIEAHLKLPLTDGSKSDVYTRLKALEDRILFLEGLSPEYFQNVPGPKRQKEVPAVVKDPLHEMSLQDIDDRIQALQSSLKLKRPGTGWLH